MRMHHYIVISGMLAMLTLGSSHPAYAEASATLWPALKEGFFPKRQIEEADFIKLSGPRRAESGAQVPITLTIDRPQSAPDAIKSVYIIVDANPIPLAATYHLSELLGTLELSTRIRLETDSYIHAIGETADGRLYMTAITIRASGGCGGTLGEDETILLADAGKIKLNVETPVSFNHPTVTTFNIKHPMFTGLQRDLVSQGFRPAFYINQARFTYNGRPVLIADFGVGTSEDPYLRFNFIPPEAGVLEVHATDTEEGQFSHSLSVQ
ncbi:sulfur-oxidizing protein SoxY [Methylobacillus rhizosphaerae]|uniref:Sulfur-oxidizing protein SoxY n=1 Tax=Methylobacillus rhizosphaerae TaxID=551994 RepID=A0A238XY34_9PROT|nr:quinoprotein dehydrogenase-associated SoxYZ-like carrier [Methylobacillus rhizosphaerae]SNR63488.1 sulfur-oxidizing protein SoxY [Methylobacillus rhizosphaerae]